MVKTIIMPVLDRITTAYKNKQDIILPFSKGTPSDFDLEQIRQFVPETAIPKIQEAMKSGNDIILPFGSKPIKPAEPTAEEGTTVSLTDPEAERIKALREHLASPEYQKEAEKKAEYQRMNIPVSKFEPEETEKTNLKTRITEIIKNLPPEKQKKYVEELRVPLFELAGLKKSDERRKPAEPFYKPPVEPRPSLRISPLEKLPFMEREPEIREPSHTEKLEEAIRKEQEIELGGEYLRREFEKKYPEAYKTKRNEQAIMTVSALIPAMAGERAVTSTLQNIPRIASVMAKNPRLSNIAGWGITGALQGLIMPEYKEEEMEYGNRVESAFKDAASFATTGTIFQLAGILVNPAIRQTITKFVEPKKITIYPHQARDFFRNAEMSPYLKQVQDELPEFTDKMKQVVKTNRSITYTTSAEEITYMMDRPWWAKFKKTLGLEPFKKEITRFTSDAKQTIHPELLESGKIKPKVKPEVPTPITPEAKPPVPEKTLKEIRIIDKKEVPVYEMPTPTEKPPIPPMVAPEAPKEAVKPLEHKEIINKVKGMKLEMDNEIKKDFINNILTNKHKINTIIRPYEIQINKDNNTAEIYHSVTGKMIGIIDENKNIIEGNKDKILPLIPKIEQKLKERWIEASKNKPSNMTISGQKALEELTKTIEKPPEKAVLEPKIPSAKITPPKPAITPEKVSIPKELEPLAEEARKYKTAEEFAKAKATLLRGAKTEEIKPGEVGVYLTPSKEYAKTFAGKEGVIIKAFANVKKTYKIPKADEYEFLDALIENPRNYSKYISELKSKGYDSILSSDEKQLLVFDSGKVLTKSQLTDFYNQVVKATKPKEIKTEVKPKPEVKPKEIKPEIKPEVKETITKNIVDKLLSEKPKGIFEIDNQGRQIPIEFSLNNKNYVFIKESGKHFGTHIAEPKYTKLIEKGTGKIINEFSRRDKIGYKLFSDSVNKIGIKEKIAVEVKSEVKPEVEKTMTEQIQDIIDDTKNLVEAKRVIKKRFGLDLSLEEIQSYKKSFLSDESGHINIKKLKAFLGTNRNIKNAVGNMLGRRNQIVWELQGEKNMLLKEFSENGVKTKEDAIALFNRIDNLEKYHLPENLKNKKIYSLIEKTRIQTSEIRKKLQSSNLLGDEFIDDERYMMTVLENTDGTPPTKKQIFALQQGATKPLREAMRELSYKPDPSERREYLTADERDIVLKRIMNEAGLPELRTKRNFFDVYDKYVNMATNRLTSADFIQSFREDAKANSPDVKEWYDPKEYKAFKENLKTEVKQAINEIMGIGKEIKADIKIIKQLESAGIPVKTIITNLEKIISNTEFTIGSYEIGIQDIFEVQKKEISAQLDLFSTSLTEYILKEFGNKRASAVINNSIRYKIKEIREKALQELSKKQNEYLKKYIEYTDELGYTFPKKNLTISQMSKLTGLLFSPQQARALEKVSQRLKASNLEDMIRAGKLVISTGDLFQFPEMLRQLAFIDPVNFRSNVRKIINMTDEELYHRGIEQTKYHLNLRKPADVDIDLFRTESEKLMNKILAETDKSTFKKLLDKSADFINSIPILRKMTSGVTTPLQKLEYAQWQWALPRVKSVIQEVLSTKLLKDGYSFEEANIGASIITNEMMQGLNWEHLMTEDTPIGRIMTKERERFLRIIFFGSDRLTSVWLRYAALGGKYAPFYWYWLVKGIIIGGSILEGLSYAINGKSTFENESGRWWELELPFRDEKGNKLQVQTLGTFIEPLRLVEAPGKYTISKLGITPRALGVGEREYYKPKNIKEFLWRLQPIPMSMQVLTEQLHKSEKARFGETEFPTALLRAGLEFSGLPTTFRTKQPRYARIQDVFSGEADLYQYLLSRDIKPPSEKELREKYRQAKTTEEKQKIRKQLRQIRIEKARSRVEKRKFEIEARRKQVNK